MYSDLEVDYLKMLLLNLPGVLLVRPLTRPAQPWDSTVAQTVCSRSPAWSPEFSCPPAALDVVS